MHVDSLLQLGLWQHTVMLVYHQSLSQVSQLAFSSLQVVMVKMAKRGVSIIANAIIAPLAIELEIYVAIELAKTLAKTLAVVLASTKVTMLAKKLVTEPIESMVIESPFAKEDSKGFKTIEFLLVDPKLVIEQVIASKVLSVKEDF